MGAADTATKSYLSNPEIFADVCNFCIFGGKKVITAEQLTEKDTAKYMIISGEEKTELTVQKQRDVQKMYTAMTDGKLNYLLIGIENQQDIHYAMPARILMYDAIDYQMQIKAITARHAVAKDKGINFWPDEKIVPCVNIVIYYGSREWDAAQDIIDMMNLDGLPREIQSFVNPYPIHVISPISMSDEEIAKFRTDIRMVMLFIKNSHDKKKARELIQSDPGFKSMDPEAIEVIRTVTHSYFPYEKGEGGKVDMCKALDDWLEEEKDEKARRIALNMYKLGIEIEKIADSVECSVETVKEWIGITKTV